MSGLVLSMLNIKVLPSGARSHRVGIQAEQQKLEWHDGNGDTTGRLYNIYRSVFLSWGVTLYTCTSILIIIYFEMR